MDVQGSIRIFIIQAAPKEVEQLHDLLEERLVRAQLRHPKKLATEQWQSISRPCELFASYHLNVRDAEVANTWEQDSGNYVEVIRPYLFL